MASDGGIGRSSAERTNDMLGGARATRVRAPSMLSLHDAAERRLGVAVVDALAENLDASRDALLESLAVSARTMARRRIEGALSAEESDRALRLARVAATAEDVLGDREAAAAWLKRPNRALGGRVPLDLIRTDAGATLVTDVLGRLEHGVFG